MLLRDLTIENYRGFDNYRLEGLARVNLLVGDNNCGKTSVLEAVALLKSTTPSRVMGRLLYDRRAVDTVKSGDEYDTYWFDFRSSVFYSRSHKNSGAVSLSVSSTSGEQLKIYQGAISELRSAPESGQEFTTIEDFYELIHGTMTHAAFFHIRSSDIRRSSESVPTDPSGRLKVDVYATETLEWLREDPFSNNPLCVVSSLGISSKSLQAAWSEAISEGSEGIAVEAVQILVPGLTTIIFAPVSGQPSESQSKIYLDISGIRRPLSEMGDGTKRLLAFGVALGCARRGCLVIDEIDTGLHYSRLADMWRMVIQTAKDLDVQVFATTHSSDCIRGLADAVRDEEDLISEVAIHSIDRRLKEAVRYAGDELETIVRHEIEVR